MDNKKNGKTNYQSGKGNGTEGLTKPCINQNFESWINSGADDDMVKYAEVCGVYMAYYDLSASKIRSFYGEIKRIQMLLMGGDLEKEKSAFYLLKPKVAYALGRDKDNKGLQLFKEVFDNASRYVKFENKNKTPYNNFCNLFEAILAYHKANYYDKKDKDKKNKEKLAEYYKNINK